MADDNYEIAQAMLRKALTQLPPEIAPTLGPELYAIAQNLQTSRDPAAVKKALEAVDVLNIYLAGASNGNQHKTLQRTQTSAWKTEDAAVELPELVSAPNDAKARMLRRSTSARGATQFGFKSPAPLPIPEGHSLTALIIRKDRPFEDELQRRRRIMGVDPFYNVPQLEQVFANPSLCVTRSLKAPPEEEKPKQAPPPVDQPKQEPRPDQPEQHQPQQLPLVPLPQQAAEIVPSLPPAKIVPSLPPAAAAAAAVANGNGVVSHSSKAESSPIGTVLSTGPPRTKSGRILLPSGEQEQQQQQQLHEQEQERQKESNSDAAFASSRVTFADSGGSKPPEFDTHVEETFRKSLELDRDAKQKESDLQHRKTGGIWIEGTPVVGNTIRAMGMPDDLDDRVASAVHASTSKGASMGGVRYQWQRVVFGRSSQERCVERIKGANRREYLITDQDVGFKLQAVAAKRHGDGSLGEIFGATVEEVLSRTPAAPENSAPKLAPMSIPMRSSRRRLAIVAETRNANKNDDGKTFSEAYVPKPVAKPLIVSELLYSCMQPHFLFNSLSHKQLELVVSCMFEHRVEAGDVVIRQGSIGDNFYVVQTGSFDVFITPESGEPFNVAQIESGGSFGELALMYDMPRAATVKAKTPAVLWCIDRTCFYQLVVQASKGSLIAQFLREISLFAYFAENDLTMLSTKFVEVTIEANETIFREGDIGTDVYVIKDGEVEIVVGTKVVRRLQTRKFFGEGSMLAGGVRTASVRTSKPCVLYRISGDNLKDYMQFGLGDLLDDKLKFEAARNIPIFQSLTEEIMESYVDRFKKEEFLEGEELSRQGEHQRCFYVIRSGEVAVFEHGDPNPKALLGPRSSVGAGALISAKPCSITVKAASPEGVSVLALSAADFYSLTTKVDAEDRMILLRTVPFFSDLDRATLEALAGIMEASAHKVGSFIVREGAPADRLYVLQRGKANVVRAGSSVALGVVNAKQFFGERSLVRVGQTNASSVVPTEPCIVLSLHRDALMDNMPSLLPIVREFVSRVEQGKAVRSQKNKWKLDDLEVMRTIGQGQFGRVKLVRHKATGTAYALKMLSKMVLVEAAQQQHVLQEKLLMDEIDHPFIVKQQAAFSDTRNFYIVLELVLGGELFSLLDKSPQQRLTDPSARFYAACIVCCFEYLHSRSIVYRDLKPENILIDKHGYVKLVDLGFAKKVYGRTYTLCGTADYLAPEVIIRKGHGREADCWSLGVLIYEMLVGKAPFAPDHGSDANFTYKAIIATKYMMPESLSTEAKSVIRRTLVNDQRKRLGCGRLGMREFKLHRWFTGIKWDALLKRRMPAPHVPTITSPFDASNFEAYDENVVDEEYLAPIPELDKVF